MTCFSLTSVDWFPKRRALVPSRWSRMENSSAVGLHACCGASAEDTFDNAISVPDNAERRFVAASRRPVSGLRWYSRYRKSGRLGSYRGHVVQPTRCWSAVSRSSRSRRGTVHSRRWPGAIGAITTDAGRPAVVLRRRSTENSCR